MTTEHVEHRMYTHSSLQSAIKTSPTVGRFIVKTYSFSFWNVLVTLTQW